MTSGVARWARPRASASSRCSGPSASSDSTRPSTTGCWGADMDAFDIAAICAHPDDPELVRGGTLARAVAAGRRVAMVDLTRGESGTRGTPETRAAEAAEAAKILGAAHREPLALPARGALA